MRKIHMIAALLAMLLPTALWANSYDYTISCTVSKTGTGSGTVYVSDDGKITGTDSNGNDVTKTFTITATPDPGNEFSGWSVTGGTVTDASAQSTTVSVKATKNASTPTATCVATFTKMTLPSFSITFETSSAGTYTVDGVAPANKTGLTEATSVKLQSTDPNFLSWNVGGTTISDNPYTATCIAATTISANFLTADQVTSVATFSDLTAALSNAQFKKITIPSGTSITVAKGSTVTVPAGKQLVIDGTLNVLGTVSNSGVISGSGKLYKISYLIDQGEVITVKTADGKDCGAMTCACQDTKMPRYCKTTVTQNSPSVNGTVSCTTSWGVLLNGTTAYAISKQSPKAVKVSLDTTKDSNGKQSVVNKITAITADTDTLNENANYVLFADMTMSGPLDSSKLRSTATVDCAGKKLSAGTNSHSSFGISVLNGSFSASASQWQNAHAAFFNVSSVSLSKVKGTGSTYYFYDCGTKASPCSISITYYSSTRTSDYKTAYFYSGYYSYSFNTTNDSGKCNVYGGSYTADPASYIPSAYDGILQSKYDGSKYYVVTDYTPPSYVCAVGGVEYETLSDAVAAAGNGSLITLRAAIELEETLTIPSGKNITISLEKHTIQGGKIVNNGTLVITDSTTGNGTTVNDVSGGIVKCDIENNGTLDIVFGSYTGAIVNKAGTLTTHNGLFSGTLTKNGGTVNLKGGHFTSDVSSFVTVAGYDVITYGGKNSVCELPDGTLYDTTVSSAAGYGATPFSNSDFTLFKKWVDGSASRTSYSTAEWARVAEIMCFYQVFNSKGLDPTLVFDRLVTAGSVNLYAKSGQNSVPVDLKFNVSAGTPYRALSEYLNPQYASKTYKAIFVDNISSVGVAVTDKSGSNKGTVCKAMVEIWSDDRASDYSSTGRKVTNTVYVVGQKLFTLNAGSNKAMIRPATGAATFYSTLADAMNAATNGATVMLANDCDAAFPLSKAGTYTFDTMGFAHSDEVSVGNGLFVKSTSTVDSAAKILVPDAVATTYVVATRVAQVGGQFYDNLTDAVGAANGGVVTLLAATDETITLTAEGQSIQLTVADGVSFNDSQVTTSATGCSVDKTVSGNVATYTAMKKVAESAGASYPSVTAAVEAAGNDEIAITVTANVTENVTLPQGKALTVTAADGVTANITVAAPEGAFIVESAVEGGTKYESKKVTVEMTEPQAAVAVTKIENGEETTVLDPATITAAVNALMSNVDVPRTDNTDKLDVLDKITVTPSTIVQEVVGANTFIRSATFDVTPTLNVGQSLGVGQKLKFRLPVDSAVAQLCAMVYHNGAFFGTVPVSSETVGATTYKFLEVESDDFSPYGYTILDGETANPIAAIGTTGYATLGAALTAAVNGDTIYVFAGTFDIGSDTITVNKQVTITGAGKDTTILNSSVSGKGAFTIAADNVTIEDLTISLSNNSDMTRAIYVGNKPQANVVSNTTLQNLKFSGGRNALSVYASNLTIDSCDFSEQYRDAILLYTVQGNSAITDNTFVQTTPGGQGFIYGTTSDGTDPLSSGTLTISGNTATGGRCLYHCNNQDRFDTTTKMTLDIVGNLATDYNNKGIVFAGHESTPLGSIFNSITITNNTLFTSANRPAIQRDDTDASSLAIDASGNYWGSATPDFDSPISSDKYLIMPHTDSNNIVVNSYGTTYTPNSSSPGATVDNLLYKVMFVDEDGTTVLYETNVAAGDTPVYGGTAPTKAATAQNTFTWTGWTYGGNDYGTSDTLAPVTAAQIYMATYSLSVNNYTVTVTIPANTTITVKRDGVAISPDAGTDNEFTVPYGTELTIEYAASSAYIASGTQSQVVTADSTKTVAAPNDYSVVPAVAQIGSTYYPSLAAAVASATAGDTITMLADDRVSLTSGQEITINKPLTITGPVDGDGKPLYTIYGTPSNTGYNDVFVTSSSGTVTISNLAFAEFGNQAANSVNGHAPIFVSSGNNSVVLENLAISDFNRTAIKINGGEFLVKDCYIDCDTDVTNYRVGGIDIANDATGTIVGTTITNADTLNPAEWVSAGLEIIGSGPILVEDCEITDSINGIFVSTATGVAPGSSVVTVVNTTVEADMYSVINDSDSADAEIAVESGSYTGMLYAETETGLAISGGSFDDEVPEEYCADGYIPAEQDPDTGMYTVKQGAYVAQIVRNDAVVGKYETFTNALDVAQSGDTIQLLKDVEGVTETFELRSKNLTIDGQGLYSITAGENTTPRSVIESWGGARNMFVIQSGNVTFKDITLDGGETHYYTFLVQAKNGTTTFENVELLHGGEADSSGTEGVGYGAAVQVDGANVIVNGDFYADTYGGETDGGIFPFTALLYQSGGIYFDDGVTADIGDDLLLVGMVGAVDVSTPEGKAQVQEMLDAMNVPAGYYPYTLKLGDNALTSFTGASPLGWNGIIDYGTDIMNAANTSMGMDLDPDTTPVEVGLLTDTTLPETFTYEDSNLTINGNGNAISGTIEYTDDAGTMENVVMGTEEAPLVLDMTGLSEGKSINLGTGISATNVTIKVTEEQATTLGQAIVTWNTEGESEEDVASLESGVKVEIVNDDGDPVTDPVTGDPMEASIIWDAEMGVAYIGPCEARLSGPTHESPIYTSLASAIERAADSGDTVTLMTNIVNYTGTQDISKSLTLDGAGHTISAAPVPADEHRNMFQAWGGSVNMFKIKTGAVTFKNITLDGDTTHRYTFLISADNASASITTENVTLLHGGEQSVDSDGVTLTPGNGYGAAIHLHHGASLTVKDGFYACTGTNENGVTTGVFPFTAILPEGLDEGTSVQFELTEDSDATPTVGIGEDLLLVGMVGAFDVSTPEDKAEVQAILDWMKVPARFIPYTLKLNEGDVYSFSGASPRTWNEIIDYGKDIMEVATANGFEGLNTQETPVEVGLLVDTVLPDTFTFEDSNFIVNGNGNALSGTIEYTDNAGLIENIVMGTETNPLVIDVTQVTAPIEFGAGVAVTNVTIKMTEAQAEIGTPIIIWDVASGVEEPENPEGVSVSVVDAQGEPIEDPVTHEPKTASLIWDDELGLAYIGPCDARLTGPTHELPIYTTLASAITQAEASGDTVTLMTNVTLSAQQTIDKSIVFNLNGKVLAAAGDALSIDSGAAVQMYSAGIVTGNIAVASGTLTITNGIYVGRLSKASGDGAQFVISGGHFSEAVLQDYCAEGYSPVKTTAPEYAETPYTVARIEIIYPTGPTVESLETVGVPIPLSWISANTVLIGSEGLVLEDLDTIVTGLGQAGTNGVPLWQSYVLGFDPNVATSQLRLEGTPATADGMVTIKGLNINVPAILESQGTTVGFHLEETTPGSDSWTMRDDACTMAEGLPTFTVPLSTVDGKILRIVVDIATVSR